MSYLDLWQKRCTVLTDQEYDQRIAFGMAEKCLDDFMAQYPVEWKTVAAGAPGQSDVMPCSEVEANLVKFQVLLAPRTSCESR